MNFIKIVSYDNFPFGGAPANYVRYFALSLAQVPDNNVEVLMPKGNYGNNINEYRTGTIENITFRHLALKKHPTFILGKIFDTCLSIFSPITYLLKKKFRKELDILIVYNTTLGKMLLFLFLKRLLSTKLIVILPEFYEKPQKTLSLKFVNWINFYLGINYLTRYADRFIVLTDHLKNFLIKKNVSADNIFILPNITDPRIFDLKKSTEFIGGKITIGYCGTPTRKDGVIDLIESFAKLTKNRNNLHLLIIGDTVYGDSVIPILRTRTRELKIEESVTFTGLVPYSEIPSLLNSCQILALTRPSGVFAEAGFPTKLGEYFACKKPVLVTAVGDIKKHFTNKKHLIIAEPDNIESIADGFETLISDRSLRELLPLNAYDWLEENLNYRTISSKINLFIFR
jgi:glycosyltransferase involved in cell wall biosynthesis